MIIKFKILGERCSGTNYLRNLIELNFDLTHNNDYCWKHFFGFSTYLNSNDTLFIGIIRDPHTWMNSLYKKKWHLVPNLTLSKEFFLNEEFWSYNDESSGPKDNTEIMEDRNILTGNRYKNIFEMRHVKNKYLIKVMPRLVKNYIFIRYEDLLENYQKVLKKIIKQFNLKPKNTKLRNWEFYKNDKVKYQKDENYLITREEIINHPSFKKKFELKLNYI